MLAWQFSGYHTCEYPRLFLIEWWHLETLGVLQWRFAKKHNSFHQLIRIILLLHVCRGWGGGLRSLNFQLPTPFRLWAFSIAKILCNVAIFFPIPVPATWRITLPILSFPTSCKLPPLFSRVPAPCLPPSPTEYWYYCVVQTTYLMYHLWHSSFIKYHGFVSVSRSPRMQSLVKLLIS